MRAVIFCGHHHTGKTALLERAIGPLSRRGYRVGVAKHAAGRLDFAAKGKDLSRYMAAGAAEAHIFSTPRPGAPEPDLERILGFATADFLLIEGFKGYRGPVPRIVFGRNREEIETLADGRAAAWAGFGLGPSELPAGGARFIPMDVEPEVLADFLESVSSR